MSLVTLSNLRYGHGLRLLLDGVSGSIHESERVGLVGRNGCGKSTLFKLIARVLQPDEGEVQIARTVRVGYLEQDPKLPMDKTLRGAAAEAFASIEIHQQELEGVFERMATAEPAELDKLMARQVALEEAIEALQCRPAQMDVILTGPSIPADLVAMADQVTQLRRGF